MADRLLGAGAPSRRDLAPGRGLGGVVDYWAKVALACPVTTTQGTRDAIAAIQAAIDRAEELLGVPLLEDVVDHQTGELTPVVIVTDIQTRCALDCGSSGRWCEDLG